MNKLRDKEHSIVPLFPSERAGDKNPQKALFRDSTSRASGQILGFGIGM